MDRFFLCLSFFPQPFSPRSFPTSCPDFHRGMDFWAFYCYSPGAEFDGVSISQCSSFSQRFLCKGVVWPDGSSRCLRCLRESLQKCCCLPFIDNFAIGFLCHSCVARSTASRSQRQIKDDDIPPPTGVFSYIVALAIPGGFLSRPAFSRLSNIARSPLFPSLFFFGIGPLFSICK